MVTTTPADVPPGIKAALAANRNPTARALVDPLHLAWPGLTGQRCITGTAHLGQQGPKSRTPVVIVLASLVEVVVTQFMQHHPFQVCQVKFRIHQRVDINMTVIQVVAATGRLEAGVKENPVRKGPVKGR